MNVVCCICQEDVRVPVRFLCFPCKNEPGQPSCNSITRVCLACAHVYLQLDKKPSHRVYSRKCLTCPAMVWCSTLTPDHSYEKDFFLMSHDTRSNYACFHEKDGCGFRGTQNQLDHHLHTECAFRSIVCAYCQATYQAKEDHVPSCPQHFQCGACSEHVPLQDKRDHFLKKHNQRQCAYCKCYTPLPTFDNHVAECPERPQECAHCHKTVDRQSLYDHLVSHIHSCENDIQHYANIIRTRSTHISQIVQELQKYKS